MPEVVQEASSPCLLVGKVPGLHMGQDTSEGWIQLWERQFAQRGAAPSRLGRTMYPCACAHAALGKGVISSTHYLSIFCEPGTTLGAGHTAWSKARVFLPL